VPSPLGPLTAPPRPDQREELTRQVPLLGPRAHLAAPVISKLGGLIWMHVIHPFIPDGNGTGRRIAFSRRLLPDSR